jgi:hypothetical protein
LTVEWIGTGDPPPNAATGSRGNGRPGKKRTEFRRPRNEAQAIPTDTIRQEEGMTPVVPSPSLFVAALLGFTTTACISKNNIGGVFVVLFIIAIVFVVILANQNKSKRGRRTGGNGNSTGR